MRLLIQVNDLLAFALELIMLAVLARWGFTRGYGLPTSAALGLGAPLLAAVTWAAFAAPRAWITLPLAGVVSVKALVFAIAVAALASLGHRSWAAVLAAVVIINIAIAVANRP
ncbi:YrdB family protein [Micromonospora rubida]|uniref:YrdB family protein n=1 Tax=Micromonospora rubida TaxID=2697657 RepID=UPI001376BD38|nr:YrdB family protein [Micromonospora rubida]NBE79704.1 DUF2568 domain-containing protein [Micromonospora rubida]